MCMQNSPRLLTVMIIAFMKSSKPMYMRQAIIAHSLLLNTA